MISTLSSSDEEDCAIECLAYPYGKCVSFDYELMTGNCELQNYIESTGIYLRLSGSYYNYEKLNSGYSAFFLYDDLPHLIHADNYYFNAFIQDNNGMIFQIQNNK